MSLFFIVTELVSRKAFPARIPAPMEIERSVATNTIFCNDLIMASVNRDHVLKIKVPEKATQIISIYET